MKKWFRNIFIVLFVSTLLTDVVFAQQSATKADSSKLYRDIETFSQKRKSTKFLYRLLFKPVEIPVQKITKAKTKKKVEIEKPYSAFEGKIIRAIYITTLDPFGRHATDTVVTGQNLLTEAGNRMHFRTLRLTIHNLLLFKKNQPFDSLLVKESERLIRSQKYVHEVAFRVVDAGKVSDSVDIYIRELDKWSFIPEGGISTENIRIVITEKNVLGTGHELKNDFRRNYIKSVNSYDVNYSIPNINNTYISSTLHYATDGYKNYSRSLSVDRPFFSPFAKWAAGMSLSSQYRRDSLKTADLVNVPYTLKYGTQDFWGGNAQRIFKGNTEIARVTHLITTARYLRIRFDAAPAPIYDSAQIYSNENFYLAGIGIATRKYFQDSYIFGYGITEDVPVGAAYGLTGGYQIKGSTGRLYTGARFSFGNYIKWGYMSTNLEYGTFWRSSLAEQTVITAGINYFTGLIEIANWKFRQFMKPQITLGIHRFPTEGITINNENGIRGFDASLPGTKKMMLTLQTQSYAPWHFLGFCFGPYIIYSMGLLGNSSTGFIRSHVYSQFGLGLLMKNEYLVLTNFQLSVSFYPIIPGAGENIFKLNSNTSTDFGFRDFSIGKPGAVAYQ
jgi:hypothetical protein